MVKASFHWHHPSSKAKCKLGLLVVRCGSRIAVMMNSLETRIDHSTPPGAYPTAIRVFIVSDRGRIAVSRDTMFHQRPRQVKGVVRRRRKRRRVVPRGTPVRRAAPVRQSRLPV